MHSWTFRNREDNKLLVESNPPIQALDAFFFELADTRIPFLLDNFSRGVGLGTETCHLTFYHEQEEEDKASGHWFKEGFVRFSGHYCSGGLVYEADCRQLILDYAQRVLEQKQTNEAVQEKWLYNRRKEWFKNEEYYQYFISFPALWSDAMIKGIEMMTDRR